MINNKIVKSCFSKELNLIENKDLKEKVVKVWVMAAERGKWNKLEDIPFTLIFEDSGLLVDHTKRITRLVWNVGKIRKEKLNKNYLVAGALLHDVGKLIEYKFIDGNVVKSKIAEKMRHPEIGAKLAQECSLPNDIIHIIAAHSHEGDSMNRTPEAIIIHHCDFIDFEIKKSKKSKR